MNELDLGMLILRVVFGLFLAYHGYNKLRGPGGIAGTAGWFAGMGMKWPAIQARLAAFTEIGAGSSLAAGLLTPFAAGGVIGVMSVAIVVAHWKVGFFIFKPDQGWEYCASIAVVAFVIGMIGPGAHSVDHLLGVAFEGWPGATIATLVGVGGAASQLAISYRPAKESR
ncbi:MAG: DoxX family protein [Actinomycetota bacterium]